jgi:peroxiredoxin 2/4
LFVKKIIRENGEKFMKLAVSLRLINPNKNNIMKKVFSLLFFTMILVGQLWPQAIDNTRIPLLGELAPEFTAQSTTGEIHFPDDYSMKWKILFSHPADFTPVCSSEILQLASMQEDFDKLNTKIIVISTDGLNSHIAWVKSLETINYPGKEPEKIKFPLVSDPDFKISKKFGMLHSYTSTTKDVRGVFIIDPNDRICAVFFYPHNIGRNMDEIKRTLIALQTSEKYDILTPANWNPGGDVMVKNPSNHEEVKVPNKNKSSNPTIFPWYMNFIKLP